MKFRYVPMKCADVRRVLIGLGFVLEPRTGTNHEKFKCVRNGKMRKVTVSCHKGEVQARDVKSIISQAGLSKSEWAEACDTYL